MAAAASAAPRVPTLPDNEAAGMADDERVMGRPAALMDSRSREGLFRPRPSIRQGARARTNAGAVLLTRAASLLPRLGDPEDIALLDLEIAVERLKVLPLSEVFSSADALLEGGDGAVTGSCRGGGDL